MSSQGGQRRQRSTSLRAEQKEMTRQRLLDGAVEVFELRGYQLATVDEIAAVAGASRATFYLHFSSKPDVVRALADQILPDIEEYYAELDRILTTGSSEAFRGWLEHALGWWDEHQTVVHVFEQVVASRDPIAVEAGHNYTAYMPTFLRRWAPDQHLEARLRVWIVVLLLGRVHLMWRVVGQMPDVDDELMLDVLMDMCAAGLKIPLSGDSDDRPERPRRSVR